MESNNNFQYIILGLFIFFAVAGIAAFAIYGKLSDNKKVTVPLTVWGFEDKEKFEDFLIKVNDRNGDALTITYVEKRADNFDQDMLEALAAGKGPDIVLLPNDRILQHKDKIYEIPFETFTERNFKDSFVEEGELFMTNSGITAIPFSLDPMVMYWNRQMFADKGLVLPPQYWDEFFSIMLPLTEMDNSRTIKKSSVALGEYGNITNAKAIISTLLLQSGNKIVARNPDGTYSSVLSDKNGMVTSESSLRFFTEFSNPAKQVYSWNKSLPQDKQEFLSGDLAVYFGFASEGAELVAKNPNLNFDVALMPQIRDMSKATYGRISGFAIMQRSNYKSDAYTAIRLMTSDDSISLWSGMNVLPPVSKKLVAKRPKDAAPSIFFDSAIISKGWLDPHKDKSDEIFRKLTENITTGRLKLGEAVNRAGSELQSLINK